MSHHHLNAYVKTLENERLVRAAAARSDDAWTSLVERFARRVRGVARAHRLRPQDAEDVAQTTFLRLYEHIDAVRDPSSLGAWLQTTARRESLRVLAEARREQPADEVQLAAQLDGPAMERGFAHLEERETVAEALAELPERDRRLLRMLFADAAPSYAEIAASLDMPIGSIGPTRARCLARLRADPALARAFED